MGAIFGVVDHPQDEPAIRRMAVALRPRISLPYRLTAAPATLAGSLVVRHGGVLVAVDGMLAPRENGPSSLSALARLVADEGVERAVERAEGAFAVASYDLGTGHLSLARDATGQRCLYVARVPTGVAFASEPKALLARGDVPRDLDLLALARYLSFAYLPGEATLVAAVREVPPGTVLVVDARGEEVRRTRTWSPREPRDLAEREARARDGLGGDVYARELRATLDEVIGGYLTASDDLGPAAAFLSGGVDSSLVVALAARKAPPPTCFSISFGDELPNELAFSRLLADHVGAKHEILEVGPTEMAGALTKTIYHLDDPIGDPLTVPNYLLAARAAERGFRRVWNGEGGDPCFGGPKNIPMMLAEWYGDGDPLDRERAYLRAYQKLYDDLPGLFAPGVLEAATRNESVEAIVTPFFEDQETRSFLNKLQTLNLVLKGGSHILVKVEKMYGAHGLLPLSPLFDRRVAERAWEAPPSLKLRGNVEKHVLKEAVKDVVPAAIIERKKSGMLVPVHPWLKGPMRELFLDVLGPAQVARRGYFRPEAVADIVRYRGASGVRGFYGAKLWLLLTLEVWMSLFLDGGAARFEDGEATFHADGA